MLQAPMFVSPPPHRSPRAPASKRRARVRVRQQSVDATRGDLFMSVNDPIVVLDLDGRYLDANHAACRLLGYTLGELRTMTSQQVNRVSDEFWRSLVADLSQLGPRTAETTYFTREGVGVPVEVSASQTTYRGRPAIVSVARDMSRHKTAEAQLVQYSTQLAALASGAAKWAHGLSDGAPSTPSPDELLREYVDRARLIVPFSSITIGLCIPGTQWLAVRLIEEVGAPAFCGTMLVRTPVNLAKERWTQAVLLHGGSSLQNIEEPFKADGNTCCKQGIVLPLLIGHRLLGAVSIGRSEGPGFTRRDADALQGVVNQVAVAVDSSNLLDGIRALAVLEERSRLGREMHDCVGQSIACAAVFSNEAAEMLRMGLVDEAAWAVGQALKTLQQADADLRESISAFRTTDVEPEEWTEGLRQFVHQYERQWGIRCDLRIGEGVAEACGAQGRMELVRIVQEALANVRKHAHTRRAAVSILFEDGAVMARVVDEGCGFDSKDTPAGHYGLSTMCERARDVGGELRIVSGSAGTEISVRLPAYWAA